MDLLLINNAGFVKSDCGYFISKSTGEFIYQLKKELNASITLIQFEERGEIRNGINDFIIGSEIFIKTLPYYRGGKKVISYIVALKRLFYEIKSTNDFIYIFYPGNLSFIIAVYSMLFKKDYGLYVRGKYNRFISESIFRNARFINTVGSVFYDHIKKFNVKCTIVKPMVQFNFDNRLKNISPVRKNEILYVGRIEKKKGVWEIVKAAKKIRKVIPWFSFRLVGAGAEFEEISKFIKDNELDNVVMHGPVFDKDEMRRCYLSSRVFLFPSYEEGFPRVLYEAMYFNLPVITTFVGNIPGIMKHGYNCLRIKERSEISIIKQLNMLLGDDNLSEKLAKNGVETVSKIFDNQKNSHSELLKTQLSKNVN
jgi:glycosyltransferase involved in cell wall biosynthesis